MNRQGFMKIPVAFPQEELLEDFRIDGTKILMRYSGSKNSTVPNEYDGQSIDTIGSSAYCYSNVKNVVIEEGIEVIE